MATRVLGASRWERALSTLCAATLIVVLAALLLGVGSADWLRIVLLAIGTAATVLWSAHAWRWRIVADDDGMTLDTGMDRHRRVSWDQVEGVRGGRPATVLVRDEEDVRLDGASGPVVRGRKLDELEELVDDALARR